MIIKYSFNLSAFIETASHFPHLFLSSARPLFLSGYQIRDSFLSFNYLSFCLFPPGSSCQLLLRVALHQCRKWSPFPLRNLPELLPRLGSLPPAAPARTCSSSCRPQRSSDEHIKDIQPKYFSLAPHPKVSSPSPSIILLIDAESQVRTSQNVTSAIALSLRFHILFLPSQIQFSIFSFQAIAMSDLSAATLTYLFSFPGVAAVSWPSFCLSFSSSFCSLS